MIWEGSAAEQSGWDRRPRCRPGSRLLMRVAAFINDVQTVVEAAQRRDLAGLKAAIEKTRILFKGTYGLGMNWYVLHKRGAASYDGTYGFP